MLLTGREIEFTDWQYWDFATGSGGRCGEGAEGPSLPGTAHLESLPSNYQGL